LSFTNIDTTKRFTSQPKAWSELSLKACDRVEYASGVRHGKRVLGTPDASNQNILAENRLWSQGGYHFVRVADDGQLLLNGVKLIVDR
jgi:hypothetical protein